jgi:hypothetical protein
MEPRACVKARRSRPRSGLAFTQAIPPDASGWVVTAMGRRNPCRTSVGGLLVSVHALRDRLPAAVSEDSRGREARRSLYQGHLTYGDEMDVEQLRIAKELPDFWETTFEGRVELVGVLKSMAVTTSEGCIPVSVVSVGEEWCVVAGALALCDRPGRQLGGCWLNITGQGPMPEGIKKFRTLEELRSWVAVIRQQGMSRELFEMVVM